MVSKKAQLNPDEAELQFLQQLYQLKRGDSIPFIIDSVFKFIRVQISKCEISSTGAIRSHISPWWRVLGTVVEASLMSATLSDSRELFKSLTEGFHSLKGELDVLIERAGFGPLARDTLTIYSGFNIAYTGAVRAGLESLHAVADPLLACDLQLGLEACLPLDNKGNSNVFKRVRQVDEERLRETIPGILAENASSIQAFEEGDVVLEDPSKAFERFWTMMEVSRRNDPELLTETKSWGKFSQSATATLSVLLEQPEGLEAGSKIIFEPLEYSADPCGFPIQLSSASFRRRAVFNILLTCSYVSLNASNALVTAAAKSLLANVIKSLPSDLNAVVTLLMKMELFWVSWKSANNFTKEVCGPFEYKSRLERNLEPYGENVLDLASIPGVQHISTQVNPHQVVSLIDSSYYQLEDQMKEATPTASYQEALVSKMTEYRQYVKDSILCDISDEAQVARLSASDEGMEEAMRSNNDRVLLWQFKRMRFATDLKSFSKHSASSNKNQDVESEQA